MTKCISCGKETITKIEAQAEVARTHLALAKFEVQAKIGYVCTTCMTVFCFACMSTKAKNAPTGGKCCLSCGSPTISYRP